MRKPHWPQVRPYDRYDPYPGGRNKSDVIFFIRSLVNAQGMKIFVLVFFFRDRDFFFFFFFFFFFYFFFLDCISFYFVQPTLRAERNGSSPVGRRRRRDVNKRLIAMQSAQPGGIAIIYLLSLISLSLSLFSIHLHTVLHLAFYFIWFIYYYF